MSLNPLSKNFFSLHTEDNDICQQQYKEGNAPNDQDIWSLSDSSDDEQETVCNLPTVQAFIQQNSPAV